MGTRPRSVNPEACEPLDGLRLDPQRRQRAQQRFLEVAAVLLDVLAVSRQVEDRVADELTGRVVGRLAPSVGLDDLDLGVVGDVQLSWLRAAAERDHRRVLEQDDGVGDGPLRNRAGEGALELQRLAVRHGRPQVDEVGRPPHAPTVATECD